MLAALAWRNLWRRPQRTLLSLLSIALVSGLLVFMLSFQIGAYGAMIESTLRIFNGYAQVQPPGYAEDPTIERTIARPGDLATRAMAVDGVTAAAQRVNGFAVLANGERSYGAAVVGVQPSLEAKVSSIASMIRQGRYLRDEDDGAAVLGSVLARNLGVGVGGTVTVLGSARDGSVATDVLTVVGIYSSGVPELDGSILEMPLARAQETFAMEGAVNTIALSGPSLRAVEGARPQLLHLSSAVGAGFRGWGDLEPETRSMIEMKIGTSLLIYFVLVSVVAFIILNTLLMSVLERTREFGTLLALGMRSQAIGTMVWLELLGLAVAGCLLGLAIGGGLAVWFAHVGISLGGLGAAMAQYGLPSKLYPSVTPLSLGVGPGAILLAIVVGGLAPYLRVMGLTPGIAMRGA
jgi:ABC-type lipoprotein release transport system permease subunit